MNETFILILKRNFANITRHLFFLFAPAEKSVFCLYLFFNASTTLHFIWSFQCMRNYHNFELKLFKELRNT